MFFLCKIGFHKWQEIKLKHSNYSFFIIRKCSCCNRQDIKEIGWAGNGKWHNLKNYEFKSIFEEKWFKEAIKNNLTF